jgi:conjugal transfer mating pair stabilization protein TraG
MSQADAGAAIVASLATSTNYLLGVAASAQDAVKQAIVANFMIDAQYLLPAQLGDAASAQTNLAMAQSLRSTSDSYKLMARIAESTMPKVRNAIELVQYAIFPVFLLFVVISGHQAGAIIKSYATSLFWIQLWAPLYAVMNFIITMYSRSHYTNGSAGGGLAIEQMSFLNTAIISDQAIAGMLVISIPAIAAAIVKGGEVGLQAVAGLVAPPRDPEKIASALAMGNMQMGHASLNNVSHDTQKGLTVDMNPSLRQGMTNYQARGGFDYSHFSGGGFVVRQGKSDVRADMALNDSLGAAAKENYERSQQATRQHSAEYAESALAALKQEAGFERSHSQGSSDGTGYRHGMGSSRNHEANDSLRQVDQWAKKLGVSEKVAMEMMIGASMGMNTPKLLEIAGLRGGVELAAKLRNSADASRSLEEMAQFASESSFGKKVGTVLDNGWERNYRSTDDGRTSGSEGMRASLDHARQSREAFSASLAGNGRASADVGAVAQRPAGLEPAAPGSLHQGFSAAQARFQLRDVPGDHGRPVQAASLHCRIHRAELRPDARRDGRSGAGGRCGRRSARGGSKQRSRCRCGRAGGGRLPGTGDGQGGRCRGLGPGAPE